VSVLEFRVLGPLEVLRDGEIVHIPAPKQRALLGLLLLRANEPVAQEELIDQLWGEDAPRTARASLQNQVHAIRRLLGAEVLERRPAGYVVHVESGRLDLERFESLFEEARRAPAKERAATLREALACWRGPALVEFPTEPFAQHEIGRLEEERLTALEERIDADLQLGRHAAAVAELEGLVERHPLRERLWAQLMLALYRVGRQADALATYRRAHQTFVGEVGVEPSVSLRELQRAILIQDPTLDNGDQQSGWTLERAAALLPSENPERARSLLEYGKALWQLGERRRANSTLRAAERLARGAGEQALEARAQLMLSFHACYEDGQSPLDHLAQAERVARVCEQHDDDEGLAFALREQAFMLSVSGRADKAAAVSQRAVEIARRTGDRWQEASCRGLLAQSLANGTLSVDQAIARCEEQLRHIAQGAETVPMVSGALGLLHAEAGRLDAGRALVAEGLTRAHELGAPWHVVGMNGALAQVALAGGQYPEAAAHYRSAYELVEVEADRGARPVYAAALACILARLGEIDEAGRLVREARAMLASPDDFYAEVLWRSALALVDAHEGLTDEAIRLSDEALARVHASDLLTFRGQTLEVAAIVHRLAGDETGARQALTEAFAVYERKGAIARAARVRSRLEKG
jgi:DNA-binding SARP family transcriptional activator